MTALLEYFDLCNFVIIYINKNTWGVKKVRGQEEPATKSSDIK